MPTMPKSWAGLTTVNAAVRKACAAFCPSRGSGGPHYCCEYDEPCLLLAGGREFRCEPFERGLLPVVPGVVHGEYTNTFLPRPRMPRKRRRGPLAASGTTVWGTAATKKTRRRGKKAATPAGERS